MNKILVFLFMLTLGTLKAESTQAPSTACLRFIGQIEKTIRDLSKETDLQKLPFKLAVISLGIDDAITIWPEQQEVFERLRERLKQATQQIYVGNTLPNQESDRS